MNTKNKSTEMRGTWRNPTGKLETVHILKCWPKFFQPLLDGKKTFDLRTNERDYVSGELVVLTEYDELYGYSGRMAARSIGYVLTGGHFGLPLPLVIISLLPLDVKVEELLLQQTIEHLQSVKGKLSAACN